jgi:predicted CopG family antitoxin
MAKKLHTVTITINTDDERMKQLKSSISDVINESWGVLKDDMMAIRSILETIHIEIKNTK